MYLGPGEAVAWLCHIKRINSMVSTASTATNVLPTLHLLVLKAPGAAKGKGGQLLVLSTSRQLATIGVRLVLVLGRPANKHE